MGDLDCNIHGTLDTTKYSDPLPIIGLYIASGSLVCLLAMAADTFFGFRHGKLWFPCRFSSLNATSLTLLSVATKLPVDLNTTMPSRHDQLTKLSGTAMLSVMMGFFMPSLGAMQDSELLSNLVALTILVITIVVNVCIQMGTGVIFDFIPEQVIVMFLMLVLLLVLVSAALTIKTTKGVLERQYDDKFGRICQSLNTGSGGEANGSGGGVGFLKKQVEWFWMMAHTSSPQYVLGRLPTCTVVGAICVVSALILVEAEIRSFVFRSVRYCQAQSDYRWGNWMVLIVQTVSVLLGSIAPAVRWFNACSRVWGASSRNRGTYERRRGVCKLEAYWLKRLLEWKENPLCFEHRDRSVRKAAYSFMSVTFQLCIILQMVIVRTSKFTRFISTLLSSLINHILLFLSCKGASNRQESSLSTSGSSVAEPRLDEQTPMKYFVLYLEGESDLVMQISSQGCHGIEKWMNRGKADGPTYLIDLLQKQNGNLKGVLEFESHEVTLSTPAASWIPNCWALPVVNLASIAISIIGRDYVKIKKLVKGVSEGLQFINFIENKLDDRGLVNMRNASENLWLSIDLHHRWFNVDLHSLNSTPTSSLNEVLHARETIAILADRGWKLLSECEEVKRPISGCEEVKSTDHLNWPGNVLAAASLYKICKAMCEHHSFKTVDDMFEWIQGTIADIMAACFTGLPRAIFVECSSSAIEEREKSVTNAAYILGRAENFPRVSAYAELTNNRTPMNLDEWRSFLRQNASTIPPPSPNSNIMTLVTRSQDLV